MKNKNAVNLVSAGVSLTRSFPAGEISINAVRHRYSLPLLRRDEAYNLHAIRGRDWMNTSVDYGLTRRNYHFFGEVAVDRTMTPALLAGMVASLNSKLDLALLYRHIGKEYQSLYGNAFTESTLPTNETGCYTAVSFRPSQPLRFDAYGDWFSFAWVKYRVDAPVAGSQYFFQVWFKPSRNVEMYSRVRFRNKPLNTAEEKRIDYPDLHSSINWRTHVDFTVSRQLTLRSRMEYCTFSPVASPLRETGYLFFTDVMCKPDAKKYSGNVRLMYFETDSYNTRIYAYESDLLYASSTLPFFHSGVRCYVNGRTRIRFSRQAKLDLHLSAKAGYTIYGDRSSLSNDQDAPEKKSNMDLKIQLFISSHT